jgi:hypothetical protein
MTELTRWLPIWMIRFVLFAASMIAAPSSAC